MKEKTFGARLRRLRRDADLTLVDVAQATGYSIVHLSDIENNKRSPLPEEGIKKFLNHIKKLDEFENLKTLAITSRKNIELPLENQSEKVRSLMLALKREAEDGPISAEIEKALEDVLSRIGSKRPKE